MYQRQMSGHKSRLQNTPKTAQDGERRSKAKEKQMTARRCRCKPLGHSPANRHADRHCSATFVAWSHWDRREAPDAGTAL